MKTEKEIKERVKFIKKEIKSNEKLELYDMDLTDDLKFYLSGLKYELAVLEWVLKNN